MIFCLLYGKGRICLVTKNLLNGSGKKPWKLRVGPQPDDAVPGDETVWVPQNFINGTEFNRIDVGTDTKLSGLRKAISQTVRVCIAFYFNSINDFLTF